MGMSCGKLQHTDFSKTYCQYLIETQKLHDEKQDVPFWMYGEVTKKVDVFKTVQIKEPKGFEDVPMIAQGEHVSLFSENSEGSFSWVPDGKAELADVDQKQIESVAQFDNALEDLKEDAQHM